MVWRGVVCGVVWWCGGCGGCVVLCGGGVLLCGGGGGVVGVLVGVVWCGGWGAMRLVQCNVAG